MLQFLNKAAISSLLILITVVMSCKSSKDKVLDDFNNVNESIEKSIKNVATNNYIQIFNTINSKKNENPSLCLKALTLYSATQKMSFQVDSICQILLLNDSSGNNVPVSTRSISSNLLAVLQENLSLANDACHSELIDKSKLNDIDIALGSTKDLIHDKSSMKIFLKGLPTASLFTILKKAKIDIERATLVTMLDIESHMIKK